MMGRRQTLQLMVRNAATSSCAYLVEVLGSSRCTMGTLPPHSDYHALFRITGNPGQWWFRFGKFEAIRARLEICCTIICAIRTVRGCLS